MRNKLAFASVSVLGLTFFSFSLFKIEINIKPGGATAALAQEPDRLGPQGQAGPSPRGTDTNTTAAKRPERIEVTNPVTVKRIKFARGSTSSVINGSIGRGSEHDFLLGARGDQTMAVSFSSANALFCVYAPDGSSLSEMGNADWSGVLPQSGDYRVKVVPDGRDGQYRLDVSIR